MESFSGFALLVDAALKGTIVLLAATALVILLRRGSAASRHLVWQFAVIAMLGLPVIKVVSPWRLPVLPQWRSPIVQAELASPTPTVTATPTTTAADPIVQRNSEPRERNSVQSVATLSNESTSPVSQTPWTLRVLKWIAL